MPKKAPEEAKVFAIDLQSDRFTPSTDLQHLLDKLSPQQAAAIIRIAQEELRGRSINSLLLAEDRICSYSTFFSKKRSGWIHRKGFKDALELARHEVRQHRLSTVVDEAVDRLKISTLDAALELHRQITGDMGAIEALGEIALAAARKPEERRMAVKWLGQIGTRAAVDKLLLVLASANADLRGAVIEAIGLAGSGTDTTRRLSAMATLDRADKITASKSDGALPLEEMSDAELEAIARNARASGSGSLETAGGTAPSH